MEELCRFLTSLLQLAALLCFRVDRAEKRTFRRGGGMARTARGQQRVAARRTCTAVVFGRLVATRQVELHVVQGRRQVSGR